MPGEGNTQLKWQHVAGDCRILSDILAEKDNKSPWLLFKFLDALLRGYGQVLFCNNPLTGALLLAGLAIADWTVCLWGLLAAATGLLVSVASQQDLGAVRAGATTFNSLLVGLVSASALRGIYGTALEEDPRVAAIVVAGAAICALVASGMTRLLSYVGGVPSLALPFVATQALIFFCVAHASLMAPASDNGLPVVADVTSPAAVVTQVPPLPTDQSPRPVVPAHHGSSAWPPPLNVSAPAQFLSSATPTLPRDVEIIQVPGELLRNQTPSESIGASAIRRRRFSRSAMMEDELLLQDGSSAGSTTESEQLGNNLGKGETVPVPAAEDSTVESSVPLETTTPIGSTHATDMTDTPRSAEVNAEQTEMGGAVLYGDEFLMDELMQNDGPPQFISGTEEYGSTARNEGSDKQGASDVGESYNRSRGDVTTTGTTKLGELSEEYHSTVTETATTTTVLYQEQGIDEDKVEKKGNVSSGFKEEVPITGNGDAGLRTSAAPLPKGAHPAEIMELSESRAAATSALEGPPSFQAAGEPAMSDRQPVVGLVEGEAGGEVDVEVEPAGGDVDWGRVFGSILLAPTQAFGLEHEVAGALMYLGVALSSPVTAAALAAGAIVGAFTALLVGAPLEGIYSAGWTFNAMLTHGALCGFLFVWSPLSQGVALAASAFSVAVFSAFEPIMSSVPMPVMSLPFNLTTMLFFSVASRRLWRPEALSSPEQHFRDYRAEMKKRRRDAERQRMMDEEPAKEKKAPLAESEKVSDAEEV